MLTYEDCLGLCDLTEEEVDAIRQHEHISQMAAVELGSYLIHSPEGVPLIKRIILDDIDEAVARGERQQALKLKLVLKHFVETHPENKRAELGEAGRG